jgi:hypothetical protein
MKRAWKARFFLQRRVASVPVVRDEGHVDWVHFLWLDQQQGVFMKRRDISKALILSGAGAALLSSRAQAQACAPACYPQTPEESTAGVTPIDTSFLPGDVLRYGADMSGSADSAPAINDALLANSVVFFPPGIYKVDSTINVTGDKTIIGARGGTQSFQAVTLNHTAASGSLFSCVSTQFGGVCISNFKIVGGNGSVAIYNRRPQSLFENLYLEPYNGGGIELDEGTQGSWACAIRNCKWVAPQTATPYFGYQISVNGGHVHLDNCTAIFGCIGINVDQVEALTISRPSMNRQTAAYSSVPPANGQCGIRFSGAGYKEAISIDGGYIEACTTGLWIENVQSLDVANTYFDDVDFGASGIYLQNSLVKNTTIRNCHMLQRGAGKIAIDNNGENTFVSNCHVSARGVGGIAIRTSTPMHALSNTIPAGLISDSAGQLQDIGVKEASVTLAIQGSGTAGAYQIANQQCSYTRTGRRVWLDLDITLAGVIGGGGSGSLYITGLPVTKRTGTLPVGAAMLNSVAFSGFVTLGFVSSGATSTLCLYQSTSNGATTAVPISGLTAGDRISGSISYRI